ncbi:MAG: hypothetical protein AMJ75_02640, partial [Phycisphaerae bacterium SM1_79]
VLGRGAKSIGRQQQYDHQAEPTPRNASVPDNRCNLLNKFHIANLISIRICDKPLPATYKKADSSIMQLYFGIWLFQVRSLAR